MSIWSTAVCAAARISGTRAFTSAATPATWDASRATLAVTRCTSPVTPLTRPTADCRSFTTSSSANSGWAAISAARASFTFCCLALPSLASAAMSEVVVATSRVTPAASLAERRSAPDTRFTTGTTLSRMVRTPSATFCPPLARVEDAFEASASPLRSVPTEPSAASA